MVVRDIVGPMSSESSEMENFTPAQAASFVRRKRRMYRSEDLMRLLAEIEGLLARSHK